MLRRRHYYLRRFKQTLVVTDIVGDICTKVLESYNVLLF
jgi:hypothetical protein